ISGLTIGGGFLNQFTKTVVFISIFPGRRVCKFRFPAPSVLLHAYNNAVVIGRFHLAVPKPGIAYGTAGILYFGKVAHGIFGSGYCFSAIINGGGKPGI